MTTFTRAQIRQRVQDMMRATSTSPISVAVQNRAISDICREFIERTMCNRNVVIFSVADATANGVLEQDRNSAADWRDTNISATPTLTLTDFEGYNFYTLLNCDRIEKMERWDVTGDGKWTQITPIDSWGITNKGLIGTTDDYYQFYETQGGGMFRMLPELSSSGYPFKIRIHYRESAQDLITDDRQPTDTSAPILTTGTGLSDMSINAVSNLTTTAKWDFKVIVGGATSPNTFQWRKNGGAYSVTTNMTTTAQLISDSLYVLWAALTGHTANDVWTYYQDDYRTPAIPLKYRRSILDGVAGRLLLYLRDAAYQAYEARFERGIAECKREVAIDTSDVPVEFKVTYEPNG